MLSLWGGEVIIPHAVAPKLFPRINLLMKCAKTPLEKNDIIQWSS